MSSTEPKPGPALDRAHLSAVCGDDPEFEREIVGEYTTLAQRLIAEIAAVSASGDANALFQAAHSLKGSSRSLGANPLGDVCEALEELGRSGQGPTQELLEQLRAEHARLAIELEAIR